MYQLWFLSETVCPGNLGNKSQTIGGGFIIIPVSKFALQFYVVMMSNPVSYLFAERTCFLWLPSSKGVRAAPRGGRYVQGNEGCPPAARGLWWIHGGCVTGVFVSKINTLQEH